MDDVKLYGKNERELISLINTVHIFSQDIGMKFDMDNATKKNHSDGLKLQDGKLMKHNWVLVVGFTTR